MSLRALEFCASSSKLRDPRNHRQGSVLLLVLVIIVILTLAAYTFAELMISESEATVMFGRDVQARALADSGLETVAALLHQRSEYPPSRLYHSPDLFQGIVVKNADAPRGRGRFYVVSPAEDASTAGAIRFGLVDESSKLNLNSLFNTQNNLTSSSSNASNLERERLLAIPNMTHETADAILDWIDEDNRDRQYGAESLYYENLSSPYKARNGIIESLDELLFVRGVTPDLLYGEDANRNGLLDPNENDGDLTPPVDNADGSLDFGWSAYLTTESKELNLQQDGNRRINLNESDLTKLREQLTEYFNDKTANFVVSYRRFGAYNGRQRTASLQMKSVFSATSSISTQSTFSGSMNLASITSSSSSGLQDYELPASHQVNSFYDLIGIQVKQVVGSGEILDSPWTNDSGEMRNYLPLALETISTSSDRTIEGRINLSQARKEVLFSIPEIPAELVNRIMVSRDPFSDDPLRKSSAWVLVEGLASLEEMKKLDHFVTGSGGVFRMQVIGGFDEGGPFTRQEVVIDATQQPPRVTSLKDYSDLGRGYSKRLLTSGENN